VAGWRIEGASKRRRYWYVALIATPLKGFTAFS
jgi:hypothetical protein